MKFIEAVIFGSLAIGIHLGTAKYFMQGQTIHVTQSEIASVPIMAMSQSAAALAQTWETAPSAETNPQTIHIAARATETVAANPVKTDVTPTRQTAPMAQPETDLRPAAPSALSATVAMAAPEKPNLQASQSEPPVFASKSPQTVMPTPQPPKPEMAPQDAAPQVPELETAPPQPWTDRANMPPPPRPKDLFTPPPTPASKSSRQTKANASAQTPKSGSTVKSQDAPADVKAWGQSIHRSVERQKFYPNGTLAQGTVVLEITVAAGGALVNVKVIESSGDSKLDAAAAQAAKRATFPKAPATLTKSQYRFRIPVKMKRR